jgi:chemotaxis signal transduction protein
MSEPLEPGQQRLIELRRAFDQSFGVEARQRAEEPEELLAITLGSHPYALRLRQVQGLYVDLPITALPVAPPELLGLAAVRGELCAVYSLASLLGYAHAEPPRYLVLGAGTGAAYAFGTLHGHLRVARSTISSSAQAREPWLRELIREADQTRPIIELGAIAELLERRIRSQVVKEND